MVNATGPWVERFLRECTPVRRVVAARLIKGSHIVVGRALPSGRALSMPNDDGRVVFVIPFETELALIGTTDVAMSRSRGVAVSGEEVSVFVPRSESLSCGAQPVTGTDVVWTYSGVRALHGGKWRM